MILLVDSGNTALKWAFVKAGKMTEMSKIARRSADVAALLSEKINPKDGNKVHSIFISNVAGASVEKELTSWCHTTFQIQPVFATVSKKFNGLVKIGRASCRERGWIKGFAD